MKLKQVQNKTGDYPTNLFEKNGDPHYNPQIISCRTKIKWGFKMKLKWRCKMKH